LIFPAPAAGFLSVAKPQLKNAKAQWTIMSTMIWWTKSSMSLCDHIAFEPKDWLLGGGEKNGKPQIRTRLLLGKVKFLPAACLSRPRREISMAVRS
jgi:hypothetical protein